MLKNGGKGALVDARFRRVLTFIAAKSEDNFIKIYYGILET